MAAFERAPLEAPVRPVRTDRRPAAGSVTRGLVVKVAVAATVLFGGGVAFAATTGSLPDPIQAAAHDVFADLGVPAPAPAPTDVRTAQPERDGDADDDDAAHARPTATPDDRAADEAARLGELCHDFEQAQRDGEELEPEDRNALVAAAGGEAKVAGFCAALVGDQVPRSPEPSGPTTPAPTGTGDGDDEQDPGGSN